VSARIQLLATSGTPAPMSRSPADAERVAIDVLCPERSMAQFSFGRFLPDEADVVQSVRCPVCGGTHILVSAAAWIAGIGASADEMRAVRGSRIRNVIEGDRHAAEPADEIPPESDGAESEMPDSRRDRDGVDETPATQGLKTPPVIPPGEDSGEWPRGGGADPAEIEKRWRERNH
jgi:hypothetical protein